MLYLASMPHGIGVNGLNISERMLNDKECDLGYKEKKELRIAH